jgi:hypothetical protein
MSIAVGHAMVINIVIASAKQVVLLSNFCTTENCPLYWSLSWPMWNYQNTMSNSKRFGKNYDQVLMGHQ